MSQDGNPHGAATVALLTAVAAIVTDLVQSKSVDPDRLVARLNSWMTSDSVKSSVPNNQEMMNMVRVLLVNAINGAKGNE